MKKIFYNGTIITMEAPLYVEAVLVNNGIIEKIGTFDQLTTIEPDAKKVDLQQKTMMPAFIDAHGHFSSYANAQLQVPLEGVNNFEEIGQRIGEFIQSNQIKDGEWVVAKGYDHNSLAEKCHPDVKFLDDVAPNNPVILQHQSGHCGVLNSKALADLEIDKNTPAPVGGVIGIENGQLTGYMEEEAYIQSIKKVPMADLGQMISAYKRAQKKYFSYGITTVQEGMMVEQMLPLYKSLLDSGILEIDVVGYPDINSMDKIKKAFGESINKYHEHFKIGGYKIITDGSPQMKTAWMKTPYYGTKNEVGYGTQTNDQVVLAVEKATVEKTQILAHCNGDAAIQQYIDAIKKVALTKSDITKLRPVIIHSQLITEEQLDQVAELNIIPSFFVAHVYHWGDVHIKNFGFERAKLISPAKYALDKGVTFTFHQDAPVIEPDMLETVQCAVTRKTKEGVLLGEEQTIPVIEALKAVTINGAYQYFEENTKGSIKEGKNGDFVILSENPLKVKPDKIKEILVLETIKDGETVFKIK